MITNYILLFTIFTRDLYHIVLFVITIINQYSLRELNTIIAYDISH